MSESGPCVVRSFSGRLTLAELAVDVGLVSAAASVSVVERLFLEDRRLRAVVVQSRRGLELLSRDHLQFMLTGRLGYGRALYSRATVGEFLLEDTFVLPADLSVADAAQRILERPPDSQYHDFLILAESGPRLVSVSQVFACASESFRYAALHDHLTGLPNRRQLKDRWAGLSPSQHTRPGIAVLYIDLDSFKAVNDTYGHRVGDSFLMVFAERLRRCVRPGDVVARVGGDEFAALLIDVDEAATLAVADRIVAAASEPFAHDDRLLQLSASVGIAMPRDVVPENELSQLDVLLRHADGAMLKAKSAGKHQVRRLDGRDQTAPFARRAMVRRRLNEALANGRLALHYQPKLDLATGSCREVEALLRWDDAELGMVSPAEFIPIAETTDQIHRIGRWVITEACRQARAWLDSGTPRTIAVNISPVQFTHHTLVAEIFAALQAEGLPTDLLRVEVTEGSAVADLPEAIEQLNQLRAAGICIDLDDFGTGHSSLAMLRTLPLSAVKLDKAFIDNIDTTPADAVLVRGVIDAAHALGLNVIAEGVERPAQLHSLRDLGCDTVQGFLICHPVPARTLTSSAAFAGFEDPRAQTL